MDPLLQALIQTGLLQFGRFERDGQFQPWRLVVECLAAYPDALRLASQQLQAVAIEPLVDRLIADADSVALGVALALESDIPLIYSRGRGEAAAFDLVGAYDSGHTAKLITGVFDYGQSIHKLLDEARSVGLRVNSVIALIDLETNPPVESLQVQSALTLAEAAEALTEGGWLSSHQQQAVLQWIEDRKRNRRFTPHPGAAAP